MKIVHVAHPTSGFPEADLRHANEIKKEIDRKNYLVVCGSCSAFSTPIKLILDGVEKQVMSTLAYLAAGIAEEVWVYGHVDNLMEQEISLAAEKNIAIVPMDEQAQIGINRLGIVTRPDRSVFWFWAIFIVLVAICSFLMFLVIHGHTQS